MPCNFSTTGEFLCTAVQVALVLLTKAFSVRPPSVWNLMSYNCRSVELFSTFRYI